MKYTLLLVLFIISTAFGDDIYLKTGFIIKNTQIIDSITTGSTRYLLFNTKDKQRKVPLENILKIVVAPYDLTVASRTIDIADSNVTEYDFKPKSDSSLVPQQEQNVEITTYSGEKYTGEFIRSTDSTVIYRSTYGELTIPKKDILNVTKQLTGQSPGKDAEYVPIFETEQQRLEYSRKRLSIELSGLGIGTTTGSPFVHSSIYLTQYSTWRNWTANEGFTKLSEEEFFTKTGYAKEATLAGQYYKKQKDLVNWGIVLGIAGAILNYVGWTAKETNTISGYTIETPKPNYSLIIVGSVSSLVGISVFYSGTVGLKTNWSSYSTVQGITDEYNRKLESKIKGKQ